MLTGPETLKRSLREYLDGFRGMRALVGVGVHDADASQVTASVQSLQTDPELALVRLDNPSVFARIPEAFRSGKTVVLVAGRDSLPSLELFVRTVVERMPEWHWGTNKLVPREGQRVVLLLEGVQKLADVPVAYQAIPYWTFI